VVLAPYDIAATAIGVGAVRPRQACSILGTTLCTEVVTDEVRLGAAAGLTVASGVSGRYLRAFPTLAGGEVLSWACQVLGVADAGALVELAAASDIGAHGLVFLPYLSPAGERAPFLAPQARGSLLGMSLEHGRADIARAVLEGLSLVLQDCLVASGAAPRELRVCGGGAASPTWLQLIADVTGVPVSRSTDSEVGARGAFLTATVATGAAADHEAAVDRHVTLADTLSPHPDRAAAYAALFGDFLALRDPAAAGWPHLAALRGRLGPGTGGPVTVGSPDPGPAVGTPSPAAGAATPATAAVRP
jgi:xylulokinase